MKDLRVWAIVGIAAMTALAGRFAGHSAADSISLAVIASLLMTLVAWVLDPTWGRDK